MLADDPLASHASHSHAANDSAAEAATHTSSPSGSASASDPPTRSWTAQRVAEAVQGDLDGPGALELTGVQTLDDAKPGHLSFIGEARFVDAWKRSHASAALIQRDIELSLDPDADPPRALIRVDDADLAMARALALFAPEAIRPAPGVHPSAEVDPSATLGREVAIGAGTYVGPEVALGDHCVLHPNVTLIGRVELGEACELHSGVVIRERCRLGRRCILHPNVTVGSDGFGYRPSEDGAGLVKIPQIGGVWIGDDVEIGAGTCVDRGKFAQTRIGSMTKIDNLCQIAHNCVLGRSCILVGQVGLAGSVTIGDGAVLGGKAGVRDHITIGAGAQVAAYAAVMDDVPAGERWGGYPAQEIRQAMRELSAQRKLPDLVRRLGKK